MAHVAPFIRLALAAVAPLAAGCSLPPYTTAAAPFTVQYAQFLPGFTVGTVPGGVPAFTDIHAPASTIDVPAEARTLTITSLYLIMTATNNGPVPLDVKYYLARTSDPDVYKTAPLGGQLALPPRGAETEVTFPLDVSFAKETRVVLGYSFSNRGSTGAVTFSTDDVVNMNYRMRAQIKVF